jgi:hypothetical protein
MIRQSFHSQCGEHPVRSLAGMSSVRQDHRCWLVSPTRSDPPIDVVYIFCLIEEKFKSKIF